MARHALTAGSDVAAFGLWDVAAERTKNTSGRELEAAAARGDVLAVRTGGDGTYQVELWIEEPFVAPEGQPFEQIPGELGLHLKSGALVVDGLEFFATPDASKRKPALQLDPGWYRAEVHINRTDPEELECLGANRAQNVLTPDERARYEELGRRYNRGCLGLVVGALMAAAALFVRGWFGLVMAAAAAPVLAVAVIRHRRVTVGTDYLRLHEQVLKAEQGTRPADFVIVLRQSDRPLPGGLVESDGRIAQPAG